MSFYRPAYPEKLVRPTLLALTTLVKLPERASVTFSSARRTENQISLSLFLSLARHCEGPLQTFTFSACRSQHLAVVALRFHLNHASIDRPPIQEDRLSISLFVPFRAVFGKTINRCGFWIVSLKCRNWCENIQRPLGGKWGFVTGRCQWPFYISSGVTIWFESFESREYR
jgi:hypothetical protein